MSAEPQSLSNPLVRFARALLHWFDTSKAQTFDAQARHDGPDSVDWVRTLPFLFMHAAVLFVFVVGWSPVAVIVCVGEYLIRLFCKTPL